MKTMTDIIEVKTTVRFKPWIVPDYANLDVGVRPRQEGFKPSEGIPVGELDPEVLDALAQRWLDNLYASVKRRPPFRLTPKESTRAG